VVRETGNCPFFLCEIYGWVEVLDLVTQRLVAEVETLAEPLLEAEGMTLVDVEFRREPGGRILRIVIDKEGGVVLQDCADISRQLGDLLDVKLQVDGPYHMEVSSPGLDRPLTKLKHFAHFKGRRAVIRTKKPMDGKNDFKGVLAGVDEDVVLLQLEKETLRISSEAILKARLDY